MKLTNIHISDADLQKLIERVERWQDWEFVYALLELKQRRAEDRQREFDNGSNNA